MRRFKIRSYARLAMANRNSLKQKPALKGYDCRQGKRIYDKRNRNKPHYVEKCMHSQDTLWRCALDSVDPKYRISANLGRKKASASRAKKPVRPRVTEI
jgi:hypothetical protein